jgi:phosphoribosyl-AMP cyclohydrolase
LPSSFRRQAELEDAGDFTPRFDDRGLVTASSPMRMTANAADGGAHECRSAGADHPDRQAHYFSRSRGKLWKKGETSGNFQTVKEIRTDCDQDAVWLRVNVTGHDATCHTGRRSCFYRTVNLEDGKPMLEIATTNCSSIRTKFTEKILKCRKLSLFESNRRPYTNLKGWRDTNLGT